MPYLITKGCRRKDSFCIAACPFDCIDVRTSAPNREPRLSLDTELCTDCGACALVCPEDVFAAAPPGYVAKGLSVMPSLAESRGKMPKPRKPNEMDIPTHALIASLPAASHSHHVQ
jgi:NAD-dependent dihydropyrimidine dehydrogenase PreA subunit